VLEYVGRYTHRVAISNDRLLDIDGGRVRFTYRDYRDDSPHALKTMTLAADEFIRRFLLHVLTAEFHRIRYYGFWGLATDAPSWLVVGHSSGLRHRSRRQRPRAPRPTIATARRP
jgi:hypothetical protein